MIIVLQTQIRENYGAHAWDGEGECPQHWKYKGGNTYIVEGVTAEQAQSAEYWAEVEGLVYSNDEYWNEYVIDSSLVDEVDFDESNHCESWETPTYLTKSEGEWYGKRTDTDPAGFRPEILKMVTVDRMSDGKRLVCDYHLTGGVILDWDECQDYFRILREIEEAEELRIANEAGFATYEDYINDKYSIAS